MERLENILQKNYRLGLTSGQFKSIKICGLWDNILKEIDKRYIGESKAVKFSQGILTVNVCSSAIMMELSMLELIILEKYEEVLENKVVEKIKYRLGNTGKLS